MFSPHHMTAPMRARELRITSSFSLAMILVYQFYSIHNKHLHFFMLSRQKTIKNYLLTIVEISEITPDEVRELFRRLNLGVPLNARVLATIATDCIFSCYDAEDVNEGRNLSPGATANYSFPQSYLTPRPPFFPEGHMNSQKAS